MSTREDKIVTAKVNRYEGGKYYLEIIEPSWNTVQKLVKAKPGKDPNNLYLCLPFKYSISFL